jgi:hypothetical protein
MLLALTPYYRSLTLAIGLVALFFGVYGLLLPPGNPPTTLNAIGVANLEFIDNVIPSADRHLGVRRRLCDTSGVAA